jgi:glucose-1-phosphate thymidylyltransferase
MRIRGILLAGGTGSRLHPLTQVTNKHLLPVGRLPMIVHPVRALIALGITDILVVTGREHAGHVVGLLGNGHDYGCSFTYRVQDQPGGIAQALGLAESFCQGDPMLVLLGDNIFESTLAGPFARFQAQHAQGGGARLLLKEVPDPGRFGVAEMDGERLVRIHEKPAKPSSRLAVTGIYFYDAEVFDHIRALRPSPRGELEITDVNNAYAAQERLSWEPLDGWWTDAGTFESLATAERLVRSREGHE